MSTGCSEIGDSLFEVFEQFITPQSCSINPLLSKSPLKDTIKSAFYYLPRVVFFPIVAFSTLGFGSVFHALGFFFSTLEKTYRYTSSFFGVQKKGKTLFSDVLEDPRKWGEIENLGITFNKNFRFGPATCTWQDSGARNCPYSQWSLWETKCVPEENRSGKSADLFSLYKTKEGRQEIIDRLKALGSNSYRFSIEWSHIEPRQGEFNEENLQIYIDVCKALKDSGITPIITLHHFSEPQWFHDKGSFEKQENIQLFVNFVNKIAPSLTQTYKGNPLVPYICTINEPAIDAFSRYVRGAFSPGNLFQFAKAGRYLYHSLKAHNAAYEVLKKMAPQVQIGIVHQYLKMTGSNPITSLVVRYINKLVNETTLHCAQTGRFKLSIPFSCNFNESLEIKTDFVGLQYYVRPIIGIMGPTSYYGTPMTKMPFQEDPEGLYKAILDVHASYRVPVLITENGISPKDEIQRARYLQRALYATKKAQEALGLNNVIGYLLWSFCDNGEWDMGMKPQDFGAYEIKADGTLNTQPKAGVAPFINTATLSNSAA